MVPPPKKGIAKSIKKSAPTRKIGTVAAKLAAKGVKHPVKKAEELTNWQKFRKGQLDPSNSFGKHIGGFFGGDFGSKLGDMFQGGFRSITGMGDYDTVSAPLMKRGMRLSYKQRAKLHGGKFFKQISGGQYYGSGPMPFVGKMSPRVRHKEFIANVNGTTSFSRITNGISPNNQFLFPWLSKFASNFQQYRIHGMEFYFETTSSDYTATQALGSVMMATQYDVKEKELDDTVQILDHEFSTTSKPNRSFYHPIECKPSLEPLKILYIRDVGEEENSFNTFGKFVYATDGNAGTGIIGRLWVTYDIEFLKPRLPQFGSEPGGFWQIAYGPDTYQTTIVSNLSGGPSTLTGLVPHPLSTMGMTLSYAGTALRITFPKVSSTRRFLVTFDISQFTTGAGATQFNPTTSGATAYSTYSLNEVYTSPAALAASTAYGANAGYLLNFILAAASSDTAMNFYLVPTTSLASFTTANVCITIVELPEAWSHSSVRNSNNFRDLTTILEQPLNKSLVSPSMNHFEMHVSKIKNKKKILLEEIEECKSDSEDESFTTEDMEIPDTNLPVDEHIERLRLELERALHLRSTIEKKAS